MEVSQMKKIDELKQALATVKEEVRSLNDSGKIEDAEAKLAELRSINSQIKIQAELDAQEIVVVETKMENRELKVVGNEKEQNHIEERNAFIKSIRGLGLNEV